MTGKKYYQLAFLSPLVLPVLVMAGEAILGLIAGWKVNSQFSGFLMMTVIFGGIPYVIFLVGFYVWAADKTGKKIHLYSYIVPIIYLILFFFWLIFFYMLTDPISFSDFFPFLVSSELWEGFFCGAKSLL